MENVNQYPAAAKAGPKEVFSYLLVFVLLYASTVSLITLLFAYISALFPDELGTSFVSIYDQIRLTSAILIVVFPVYLLLSWYLARDANRNPEKRELKIKKWLTYLTLFASALTIIIDLAVLVYRFYSGDYSVQFLLKILAVLVVAAAIFGYYFWDLRRTDYQSKKPKIFAWLSLIAILGALVSGFFVVGSPATQRNRRFDERRISDLQGIQGQITNYWIQKNRLPNTLNDLKDDISGFIPPVDPVSNANYEYSVKSQYVFELCAVFQMENKYSGAYYNSPSYYDYGYYNENWSHSAGRGCFSRTIDPELYKNKLNPL